MAGPSLGAGAATRLPLPKMAAPLAVNSGKNNLSAGLRLLLRLSAQPSRSLPALRLLRARGTGDSRLGKPGVVRRRGKARAAAGKGCGAPGARRAASRAAVPELGPAELPGDGAPRSELPPCPAGPGGSHGRQPRPPCLERTVVIRCTRGYASLRYYCPLLGGVRGKREIYPEFCRAFYM